MTPREAFLDAIWKSNNGYKQAEYLLNGTQSAWDFEKMVRRNNRIYFIEKNASLVIVGLS